MLLCGALANTITLWVLLALFPGYIHISEIGFWLE